LHDLFPSIEILQADELPMMFLLSPEPGSPPAFDLELFDLDDFERLGELFPQIDMQGTWIANRSLMRSGSKFGVENLSLTVLIDSSDSHSLSLLRL
jgi:hypothetical protein